MAGEQMGHVGETVEFNFVLVDGFRRFVHPQGLADYCVTLAGNDRIEANPDADGCFRFSIPFENVQPGDKIKLTTTAYRQRAGRDFMKLRGQWLHSDSPYELADKKMANDSIVFTVYELPIEFTIAQPPDDFDAETGVLRIRRADGSSTSVYHDRTGRPGFTLSGPDPGGLYTVRYRPTGNQLNPTGTTEVEFAIYDRSGQPHRKSQTIETP